MNDRALWAVGGLLAAAAVVGLAIANGGVLRFSGGLDVLTDEAGWAPDHYGPAYTHLCQPEAMRDRLHVKHPLFSRPAVVGGDRSLVVGNGWAWFADPPSDQGV